MAMLEMLGGSILRSSRSLLFGRLDRPIRRQTWIDTQDKYNRNSGVRLGKNQSEGFNESQIFATRDPTPPWRRNTVGHATLRELRHRFLPGIALDHVRYNDQYFPDHQFILLADSCVEPTTQLSFIVPPYLGNIEIKNYLIKIYGFRVDFVSSRIIAPLPSRHQDTFSLTGRTVYMTSHQPRRVATVHLLEEVHLPAPEQFDAKPAPPELFDQYQTNPGEMPDPRIMRKSLGPRWRNAGGGAAPRKTDAIAPKEDES